MDLTFSEIDNNNGDGFPNESYANINSDMNRPFTKLNYLERGPHTMCPLKN